MQRPYALGKVLRAERGPGRVVGSQAGGDELTPARFQPVVEAQVGGAAGVRLGCERPRAGGGAREGMEPAGQYLVGEDAEGPDVGRGTDRAAAGPGPRGPPLRGYVVQ